MTCPNCNTLCGENDRYCYHCGTSLYETISPVPEKKGTHIVPVLIMAVLCVLGLVLYFITAGSSASSPAPSISTMSETPWFQVENGTLYFDESLYNGGSELMVPSQVDGQTVTSLGYGCFVDCQSITTVILPNTLQAIGDRAFENCTAMRGIYVPESVTIIGQYAFYGCTELEAIHLSDSVQSIGIGAFDECNSLWYIFFAGAHDDWVRLYDEFINVYTGVICDDGSFYQGGEPY